MNRDYGSTYAYVITYTSKQVLNALYIRASKYVFILLIRQCWVVSFIVPYISFSFINAVTTRICYIYIYRYRYAHMLYEVSCWTNEMRKKEMTIILSCISVGILRWMVSWFSGVFIVEFHLDLMRCHCAMKWYIIF